MIRLARIAKQHGSFNNVAQLRFSYNLTPQDVAHLLVKQNGYCNDCGKDLERTDGKRSAAWCIDHNHETGKVRGLICYSCNTAVRSISKMRSHIAYLRKHGEDL
jgi:hypothetical protein